jgi:hypothetical protein
VCHALPNATSTISVLDLAIVLLGAFALSHVKRLLASSCLSVRLTVRMHQLDSRWTDIRQIWYSKLLRKSVQTLQIWLKPDKNIGHFT